MIATRLKIGILAGIEIKDTPAKGISEKHFLVLALNFGTNDITMTLEIDLNPRLNVHHIW